MRHNNRWLVVVLIIAGLLLAGCAQTAASAAGSENGDPSDSPARVVAIKGTDVNRITLTALAAKRLGIQTAQVQEAQVRGEMRKVVPYAAILYDLHGQAWVYTNPARLTYVRERVNVDFIEGDVAALSAGPPSGMAVVTIGAPELYGTEFEGGIGQ